MRMRKPAWARMNQPPQRQSRRRDVIDGSGRPSRAASSAAQRAACWPIVPESSGDFKRKGRIDLSRTLWQDRRDADRSSVPAAHVLVADPQMTTTTAEAFHTPDLDAPLSA